MADPRFFHKKYEFLTLERIVEITKAKTIDDSIDINSKKIFDIKTLETGLKEHISFLNSIQYIEKFLSSKVGFCFIDEKHSNKIPQGMTALLHKNPYFAYSQIVKEFYEPILSEFDSQSLIHKTAKIGKKTLIAPNSFIGKNVIIGENCYIAPGASIMDGCVIGDNTKINSNATISFAIIGNNCEIYNGAQIGQDGFGFVHENGVNHKILQIGIVEIHNDVEIGANSCVDRGAIENTIIHDGVKIDNLCQIAHNVEIGKGTVIAGGSGVAGSAKIGRFVQIGGGCNIGGHIKIGDGVKIAGMSGVMRDVEPMSVVAGIPVVPIKKWHRINAMLNKMVGEKS